MKITKITRKWWYLDVYLDPPHMEVSGLGLSTLKKIDMLTILGGSLHIIKRSFWV